MINIFEVFLPQLLRYPNPTDPLNGEAAALLMRDQKGYDVRVKGKSFPGFSYRSHADPHEQNMSPSTLRKTQPTMRTKIVARTMR